MSNVEYVNSLGERVPVHSGPTGDYYCPVCGYLWEGTSSWDALGFIQCLEICLRCRVQLGNDDVHEFPVSADNPAEKRWSKMRAAWLDRNEWDPDLIKEVEERLGVQVVKPTES
jgi:hypothetical protein